MAGSREESRARWVLFSTQGGRGAPDVPTESAMAREQIYSSSSKPHLAVIEPTFSKGSSFSRGAISKLESDEPPEKDEPLAASSKRSGTSSFSRGSSFSKVPLLLLGALLTPYI